MQNENFFKPKLSLILIVLMACADGAPAQGDGSSDVDMGPMRAPVPQGDAGEINSGDMAYPDGGIMPPADGRPSLGLNVGCDLEDATRYENFVLAENCPGECCWEYEGNLSDQGPQPLGVPAPIIHSAYHDYPTVNLKSDVAAAVDELRYYVPFAKFSVPDHLDETIVGCVNDGDCSAIGAGLAATCARQDGDENGVAYAESRSTEYQPCINMPRARTNACVADGGLGGDLATQSAVPSMTTDALCEDVAPPGVDQCVDVLSACVYSPAWVSHPTVQGPDPDRRAPPIIRPSGRLFIQGINLVDTEFEAYFVRVRSADRNGEATEFTRVVADPITGDPGVRLRNDAVCSFSPDAEGDCNPVGPAGLRRLAVQPTTYTRGAEAAQTWQADEVLTPMYWYLERENQWLRYHRRTGENEADAYQAAELYDDLVVVDVPDDMAPGLYSVQLKYSTNTWLSALDETLGRQRSCDARNTIAADCQSNFENPSIGALECGELEADCQSDDALYLFDTDRALMTNPIYVQIAPNFVEQTYRIALAGFTPIVSGEYGPRPGGPWVYDDVRLFSMIVRFDPDQLGPDENCGVGNDPSGAENPVCHVDGPWIFEQDDIFVDRRYDLSDRGFSADIGVRPGEVVNIITFAYDSDGGGADSIGDALGTADSIIGGVARTVAGAYGQGGVGEGVAGAVSGLFGLADNIISGITKPELIALSVHSYTAEELALLTLASQMGFDSDALRATDVAAVRAHPVWQLDFQGHGYTLQEEIRYPGELRWGVHQETRRIEARAPSASDLVCGPEGVALNSCGYRGESTYDFHIDIEHLRD